MVRAITVAGALFFTSCFATWLAAALSCHIAMLRCAPAEFWSADNLMVGTAVFLAVLLALSVLVPPQARLDSA